MELTKNILIVLFLSLAFSGLSQDNLINDKTSVVLATQSYHVTKNTYNFDISLIEKSTSKIIEGATIEIINLTIGKTEMLLKSHTAPIFSLEFSGGNHYSVVISKDGFKTKKLEAFVQTNDCLLCFEGITHIENSDTEINLTETIFANIELVPLTK